MPQARKSMMVIDISRKYVSSAQEIWFYDGSSVVEKGKNIFYQSTIKPTKKHYRYHEFNTLATPLHQAIDEIYSHINRTFKYHIRKAEKLQFTFRKANLDQELISMYLDSFHKFALRKKLHHLPSWKVKALVKSGNFILTVVEKDSKIFTMHAYVHDNHRIRLITSHTVSDSEDETIMGYCNKFHHWQDMVYFKHQGFAWYDFGGVSKNEDDGRNYFKQSFGGEPQVFYHFITCNGLMKLWFDLKLFYEKILKRNLLHG